MKMLNRLSSHVVEIDEMADRVHDGKEQSCAGADLVEFQVRIQRDVLKK